MLPKKGIVFPNNENLGSYPRAVAYALKCELGSTHQAIKIIRRWTGAGERTVKNWLAGTSGPSGQHLVDLIRHSDDVLTVLLILAGRQQVVNTYVHRLCIYSGQFAEQFFAVRSVGVIGFVVAEIIPDR